MMVDWGFYLFLHWEEPILGITSRDHHKRGSTCLSWFSTEPAERPLASNVDSRTHPKSRRIGLLRHESLKPGEGLWIYPTQAIHTFGMRFPIDVAFLDRSLRIKRIYHQLAPFRLTIVRVGSPERARAAFRLPREYQHHRRRRAADLSSGRSQ